MRLRRMGMGRVEEVGEVMRAEVVERVRTDNRRDDLEIWSIAGCGPGKDEGGKWVDR